MIRNNLPGIGFLFIILLSTSQTLNAQQKGSFEDPRDGKTYTTVTYSIPSSSVYISDNDEYGTYYNRRKTRYQVELKGLPSSMTWMSQNLNFEIDESKCEGGTDSNCEPYGRLYTWFASQDVCPPDWHLPTDNEWYLLATMYGGVDYAGKHLKVESLGGTNESLFDVKKPSIFWSSDMKDSVYAWDWKVNFRWEKLQRWTGGKEAYNLVRCVKDY